MSVYGNRVVSHTVLTVRQGKVHFRHISLLSSTDEILNSSADVIVDLDFCFASL